eukprot:7470649-Pyramimonas_sp.AAC.1
MLRRRRRRWMRRKSYTNDLCEDDEGLYKTSAIPTIMRMMAMTMTIVVMMSVMMMTMRRKRGRRRTAEAHWIDYGKNVRTGATAF